MGTMSAQLTVAVISAAVALVSIVLSIYNTRSNIILQAKLQTEQEQRREKASTESRLKEVVSRYQNPLLSGAYELQSRLYNILKGDFADYIRSDDQQNQTYAVNSTLFVLAQYLAWAEALREGIQFLDLGDAKRNQGLAEHLENIRHTLATDRDFTSSCFRIFRVDQRAIGELMLEEAKLDDQSSDIRWHCTGYASFCSNRKENDDYTTWFTRLDHDVRQLASNIDSARPRLAALQNNLVDLINFLDEEHVRFPQDYLSKVDLSPPITRPESNDQIRP
jgi:hypothetical protein